MAIEGLAKLVEQIVLDGKLHAASASSGLMIYRSEHTSLIEASIYNPIVCLIVQGEKQVTIGEETVLMQEGQCVVVGHDLPVLGRITKASPYRPYLSLIIPLDLDLLRSLDFVLDDFELEFEEPRSLEISQVSVTLIDVLGRYLGLVNDPLEETVLLPLVKKELHFRLLQSSSGAMLRALVNRESHASNVERAISYLRARYREALDVTDLAKSVGMSSSLFHRHFKAMTRTTPLQYQKNLRLTEARRLLRSGETSVSAAAFEVGYESPSQFSREYSRKFGAPPRVDVQVA